MEERHVDGVLVDNVAESGEDSEDEWNYYKGEGEPERDEHNPSEEHDDPPRSDTPCQDNVSQINTHNFFCKLHYSRIAINSN